MNGVTQKVGRITVAIGLVAFGLALLIDNLTGAQAYTNLVVKLWPLLLIGFGAEYLVRTLLVQNREQDVRLRFDVGGAFLLVLVVMLSVGVLTFRGWIAGNPFAHIGIGIGPAETRTEAVTIPLAEATTLSADIPVGSVRVEQGSLRDEIRIDATYITRQPAFGNTDVSGDLAKVRLAWSEESGVIVLRPEIPSTLNNMSVQLVVYAPPGLTVKATTGAGNIEVQSYKGDLQLSSNVGRIAVEASSGSLSASSGSGYVTVRHFEGPVAARTNVGSLDVQHMVGPLQLESGTGSIRVDEFRGGKLVAETKTGGIRVSTRSLLEGDVILKTQTGSVNLTVPEESSMRVTAQTRSGSLTLPPFMSQSRQGPSSTGVGTAGSGTYTVSLEASTGSVHFMVE